MVMSNGPHALWQVPVQVFPVAMQQVVDQQHNAHQNYDTTAQQNCANQKRCGTLNSHVCSFSYQMERRARIELATRTWKDRVIPFYERRVYCNYTTNLRACLRFLAGDEWIEHSQWRDQNPLPSHLANPQQNLVARARIELAIIAYQATVIPFNYPAKFFKT